MLQTSIQINFPRPDGRGIICFKPSSCRFARLRREGHASHGLTAGVLWAWNKLAAAYSDYRNGIGIDILPGKTRNYALYLWTMIVQQQFDKFSAKHNRQKGVPGFTTNDTYYKEAAMRAGIRPSAILAASVAIGALIGAKNVAINTLPRHAQERALRRQGDLVQR